MSAMVIAENFALQIIFSAIFYKSMEIFAKINKVQAILDYLTEELKNV